MYLREPVGLLMSRAKWIILSLNTIFVMCAAQCPYVNPPEEARTYAIFWTYGGAQYRFSMLDSATAWCPPQQQSHMTIDLTTPQVVKGIVTQAMKAPWRQGLSRLEIQSSDDGVNFVSLGTYEVPGFTVTSSDVNSKFEVLLDAIVTTRFIRIYGRAWIQQPCLRVAIIQACPCSAGYTGPAGGPCELFGGSSSCNTANQSIMTSTLCAALAGQNSVSVPTAAALGTTQLVRYSFANSWGCNAQATLPAAQRISGAAPNQVLACPQIPGAVYVKQDAPCQFACDENHTRTGETCTRVCGNVTAAACGPRHFASATCNHAGYTLYECEPCAYAAGQQALPWSALNSATCPSTPCAAGTLGANGVCAPCAMNTFSAAGSATCALCARGTFSSTGSSVCSTCFEDTFVIDVSNYGGANVLATRGVPVVLEWPSGHPALITTSTAVTWNSLVEFAAPLFPVVVDTTLYRTTFTVPEDYSGDLFYICQWHSIMGVNSISIKPAAPCAEGAVAAHSVAAVDAYFARTAAAGHNVSQHNILYDFCHARGACLPCLPGEHEQAGACVACDYAHYQPNFQMPHCFECTSGHNTTTRGSVSAADCLCQPGFE